MCSSECTCTDRAGVGAGQAPAGKSVPPARDHRREAAAPRQAAPSSARSPPPACIDDAGRPQQQQGARAAASRPRVAISGRRPAGGPAPTPPLVPGLGRCRGLQAGVARLARRRVERRAGAAAPPGVRPQRGGGPLVPRALHWSLPPVGAPGAAGAAGRLPAAAGAAQEGGAAAAATGAAGGAQRRRLQREPGRAGGCQPAQEHQPRRQRLRVHGRGWVAAAAGCGLQRSTRGALHHAPNMLSWAPPPWLQGRWRRCSS
jgi:hypothetical protein